VSRGGKTTKGGSREADEGRRGMAEATRSEQHLLSGSRLIGGCCTGAVKKLVEEDESRTSGISSIQEGDESDRPPPFDKKTMGPLSTQGDSGTMLREGRNGKGAENQANRWG